MFPRVKAVRHVRDYRLELSFTDGATRELDFRERIVGRGGVFRELEDVGFFKQVHVDTDGGTIDLFWKWCALMNSRGGRASGWIRARKKAMRPISRLPI